MNEKVILNKLFEHDERFDKIDERLEHVVTRDEILDQFDVQMKILLRLDQERLFTPLR